MTHIVRVVVAVANGRIAGDFRTDLGLQFLTVSDLFHELFEILFDHGSSPSMRPLENEFIKMLSPQNCILSRANFGGFSGVD